MNFLKLSGQKTAARGRPRYCHNKRIKKGTYYIYGKFTEVTCHFVLSSLVAYNRCLVTMD
jgi:hypothetical protein